MKFRLEQTLYALTLAVRGGLKAVRLTVDAIDNTANRRSRT